MIKKPILLTILVLGCLISAASPTTSVPNSKPPHQADKAQPSEALEHKFKLLQDDVDAIRRDQLNYKIEKDLLKETYASNIQTINIIITIALCVLAVVGYVGVKNINDLKVEFKSELDKLTASKQKLEEDIKTINQEFAQNKAKFTELEVQNIKQNSRLQLLELQEKAGNFINGKNHLRALEYITIGLNIDPKDRILLGQKATCEWGLNRTDEALQTYLKIIEIDPSDYSIINNAAELSAITNKQDEFEHFIKSYGSHLQSKDNGWFVYYLNAVKKIQRG